MKLYVLTTDFLDFSKGHLILQGATTEEGTEWFNMSIEMSDPYGNACSLYFVPSKYLTPATEDQIKEVQAYFDKINGGREKGIPA